MPMFTARLERVIPKYFNPFKFVHPLDSVVDVEVRTWDIEAKDEEEIRKFFLEAKEEDHHNVRGFDLVSIKLKEE